MSSTLQRRPADARVRIIEIDDTDVRLRAFQFVCDATEDRTLSLFRKRYIVTRAASVRMDGSEFGRCLDQLSYRRQERFGSNATSKTTFDTCYLQ